MIQITDKSQCCGCNACVQRCPKQCISMHEDSEGFLYPQIDMELCIDCGLCEKVCPVLHQANPNRPIEVLAAKNPNEEIRLHSSSGGIFTMLAEKVIDHGGVVFGAIFTSDWKVEHRCATTREGLAAFRGSKYVQSVVGETFQQAEAFLKQRKEVLFGGTPCQIAALKLFLRKKYDNLFALDFICHGVPAPGVFRDYLEEEKQCFASRNGVEDVKIEQILFRDKRKSWKDFHFTLTLSGKAANGKTKTTVSSDSFLKNPFMKGFLADLYLRPSCHACPAKELKSGSDITIGDYWGIEQTMPEIDDDHGVSCVIINTDQGKRLMEGTGAETYSATYEDVCEKNPAILFSCRIPDKRNIFFSTHDGSLIRKMNRLSKKPFMERAKGKVKTILRKCCVLNKVCLHLKAMSFS